MCAAQWGSPQCEARGAVLIALSSPARLMADGVIFPFQAHAIAAPANGRGRQKDPPRLRAMARFSARIIRVFEIASCQDKSFDCPTI